MISLHALFRLRSMKGRAFSTRHDTNERLAARCSQTYDRAQAAQVALVIWNKCSPTINIVD